MKQYSDRCLSRKKYIQRPILGALLIAGAAQVDMAHAALAIGDFMTITRGTVGGAYGFVTGGSYFGMDMNGNDSIAASEKTPLSYQIATGTNEFVGNIVIGTTFTAT